MRNLGLLFKVSERFFCMLLHGERLGKIKSLCCIDYANYYQDKKRHDEAIEYYLRALTLDSDNYYAYAGLAAINIEKKLFGEALNYCNKAIAIKEPDISMKFLLAVIYESLGKEVIAKEVLHKTLPFFGNNLAAAVNQLSYTYMQYGMFNEAERHCKEAIKLNPTEAGLHNNLAKLYMAQSNIKDARVEFQKVVELTDDKDYRDYAAQCIANINRQLARERQETGAKVH